MYHPITPVIPLPPTLMTDLLVRYFLFDGTSVLSQSSSTTSIFPSAIAWKLGWFSVMFSTLTLHLTLDSRTFFRTYTFAVEPTQEFSFSKTSPHDPWRVPPAATATAMSAAAAIASTARPTPAPR